MPIMNKVTPLVQETAICGITAIILLALFLGHDGAILVGGIATIAGIAGYSIKLNSFRT